MGIKRGWYTSLLKFVDWLDKSIPIGAPRTVMLVVFVTTLWAIWKERCQRQCRSKSMHKVDVLHRVYQTIQMCFHGISLKEDWCLTIQDLATNWRITFLPIESSLSFVSWCPPVEGWIKVNTDGSLSTDRAGYGAALLFKNAGSYCLRLRCKTKPSTQSMFWSSERFYRT
ncbi:hypothetical protein QJS04_geneDACA018729 [Acorus gramineus]|uniref:Uncharacterized protein n=1 Tax=Acorus gramineus TaxID=55184 RepID=A0AAV9A3S3_ACOGR|nr:hypothetical protein QJS04_geneDACA018729 [Acorus gramineus]